MQKALLLVAHGSRREASNDEVRGLTAAVRHAAGGRFDAVDCAFLELAEPSIPDGIDRLLREGAEQVVVLPYFLAAGRHVTADIPAILETKQVQYPDLDIVLAAYFGLAPTIPSLLLELAEHPWRP